MAEIRVLDSEAASRQPLVERTDVDALVNTVNTEGVMGKGIALAFKKHFGGKAGAYFKAYEEACGEDAQHPLRTGHMQVFDCQNELVIRPVDGQYQPTRDSEQLSLLGGKVVNKSRPFWIVNFPTKEKWRKNSKLSYIENGLENLACVISGLQITSIAMPALGCGNGGLKWRHIEPLIRSKLEQLEGVSVDLYSPLSPPPKLKQPGTRRAVEVKEPVTNPNLETLCVGDELPMSRRCANEAQLFLYSAASHNPHRIHYDRAYARYEGHKELLVHGPLQGSWLTQYVADWAGPAARLRNVSWQNRASAYPNQQLEFVGTVTAVDKATGMVDLEIVERDAKTQAVLMPATARVQFPTEVAVPSQPSDWAPYSDAYFRFIDRLIASLQPSPEPSGSGPRINRLRRWVRAYVCFMDRLVAMFRRLQRQETPT